MSIDLQVLIAFLLIGALVAVYVAGEVQREYRWQTLQWKRGQRETEPRKPARIVEVLAFFAC